MVFQQPLGRNLLEGELWNLGTVFGMLNRDPANVALRIQVQERVLVEVLGFGHLGGAKLDVQRVGVLKVFDLHGVNDRSKKAL